MSLATDGFSAMISVLPIQLSRAFYCQTRAESNANLFQQLFSNAKLAENRVEQVFGGGLADDLADRADGGVQIHGDEVEKDARAQRVERQDCRGARASQRVLMA